MIIVSPPEPASADPSIRKEGLNYLLRCELSANFSIRVRRGMNIDVGIPGLNGVDLIDRQGGQIDRPGHDSRSRLREVQRYDRCNSLARVSRPVNVSGDCGPG